ncbi:MAG TPA: esterase-like activity of phytase family protein [Steroidobacteraceae bacterium]|nr:esterase-like activity of phytase family protein [Steroidobacteraceae bacterium]
MKVTKENLRVAVAALLLMGSPFAIQHTRAAELLERAVLPSASFSPGPTSGQFATGGNGVVTPFINRQPIQGFSAVLPGPQRDTFLVMSDNGFGNKANSPDALLRVYAVKPDFESGVVQPVNRMTGEELSDFTSASFITLRDPWHKVSFPIVAEGVVYPGTPVGGGSIPVDPAIRAGRLLTGGDFDIESIRRAKDGTLWFGDEFGPYLIHTDASGRVLEAPIPLPNFRRFPSTLNGTEVNPLVQSVSNPQRTLAANLPDSGGFEGLALNQSRTKLYALLEKAVAGDPIRERLIINEFDLRARQYTGKTFAYILDAATNAIGDFTALSDRQFLIIERDGGQGDAADPRFTSPARFKKIFKIDLNRADANGHLLKEEVADLMNIYDPRDVAGDGKSNTVFTFPFTTIEDVLVLDNNRLLVINDNNYPGSAGREFGVPDNNEFIVVHVAPLLSGKDCKSKGHSHHGDDQRGFENYSDDRDRRAEDCRPATE